MSTTKKRTRWQNKVTDRFKRPYGIHKTDFPPTKRDRLGDPDYYKTLPPEALDWIAKFNEEYVNGASIGKKDDEYCAHDLFSWRLQRNEINREILAARRDLLTHVRVGKAKNPTHVAEVVSEYARYLYALSGDERYLLKDEPADQQNYREDEGWERY